MASIGFQKELESILISLIILCLLGIFRPDYLVIACFILLFPYLFLTKRKNAIYHLLTSFVLALIWMLIGKNQYSYNIEMLSIFGINLFPLFAWSIGLFIIYLIYSHFEHYFHKKNLKLFFLKYLLQKVHMKKKLYHFLFLKNVELRKL